MIFIIRLPILVFCIFLLPNSLCADQLTDLITGDAESEESSTVNKLIAVDTSVQNDNKIQKRLKKIFSELDGLQNIKIQVASGVVTLEGIVNSSSTETRAIQLSQQVVGVVEVKNNLEVTYSIEKRLAETWQNLVKSGTQLIANLPIFLLALFVFVLSWSLGRWISKNRNFYRTIAPNYFIANLLGQITHLIFILFGLILALSIMDLTALLGTILGAAGIVGLAVGFAVRDTVENYIASILLSLRNPFEVNDLVSIDGNEGNVVRLTSRATILISLEGNHIRIPNSVVFKAIIVNFTRNSERRFQFDVGIDAEQDIQDAQALALKTLNSIEGVLLDPKPMITIEELGDFSVIVRVYAWMDQTNYSFLKVRSEAIRLIKQAFDQANIVMPEPIYQIRASRETSKILTQKTGIDIKDAVKDTVPHDKPETSIMSRKIARTVDTDIMPDDTIKNKVAEEQIESNEENLLDSNVPKEG